METKTIQLDSKGNQVKCEHYLCDGSGFLLNEVENELRMCLCNAARIDMKDKADVMAENNSEEATV